MKRDQIEAKIDNGEWLTDEELEYCKAHKILIWGCANEQEHHANLPTPTEKCLPLWTDEQLRKYQVLTRRFS